MFSRGQKQGNLWCFQQSVSSEGEQVQNFIPMELLERQIVEGILVFILFCSADRKNNKASAVGVNTFPLGSGNHLI